MAKERKTPVIPRPSSSVLLVSPQNHVLLLHRVQTSSAFASAHVFPGGNVSESQDGTLPRPNTLEWHQDSPEYRLAAVRETFEESGILLAKQLDNDRLLDVSEQDRQDARHQVHAGKLDFRQWLSSRGGRPDLDNLIPFTRWITPIYLPKRFTTQMYLYFLPLTQKASELPGADTNGENDEAETVIPTPTSDGGIEHTAARFLPPSTWLRMAKSDRVILFPPQFFLLHLLSEFLSPNNPSAKTPLPSLEERQAQRDRLLEFVHSSDPPWGEKAICPIVIATSKDEKRPDGRQILGLEKPGPELSGKRRGEFERVMLVDFQKGGPRRLNVGFRKDVLAETRAGGSSKI